MEAIETKTSLLFNAVDAFHSEFYRAPEFINGYLDVIGYPSKRSSEERKVSEWDTPGYLKQPKTPSLLSFHQQFLAAA
jgi:hypothetical protein